MGLMAHCGGSIQEIRSIIVTDDHLKVYIYIVWIVNSATEMAKLWVAISLLLGVLAAGENLDTETINPEAAKIEPKIVGGSAISIDQIPYQVSIRLTANDKKSYGSGHLCGGVVISQRLVATAAHCCYNTKTNKYRTAGEYVLVMGSSYLRSSTNLTLEYYLQQLIAHENYDATSLTNDIALMFINGYIPWGWPTVKALALSSQVVATGTDCLISGWGLLQQSATSSSNSLQAATVPIISQTTCQMSYGPIPSSQVCAGYWTGGTDACQGDSGGPLRCNGQLAGLVSYGSGCAVAGFPGVYTNVSFYNGWIVQQNNSLNYSIYHSGGMRLGSRWSLLGCLALILAFILDHRI